MATQFDRFRDTMKRVLMLDQADLDFGIYRIMNKKRTDIERYLDRDLRQQVAEVIRLNSSNEGKEAEKQLQDLVKTLTAAGINPDDAPKVKELQAKIAAADSSEDLENEVYSHLTTFFSRYYSDGDFISQRRYKKDVYAIPYEGEEVKLYWANADQYYIKTGEYFRNYRFALGDGRYCEFTLKEATTEQNNNQSQNNMERRFALHEELPVEVDGDTLHINFTYELYPKATKQKALIDEAFQKVKDTLPAEFASLLALRPTEKDKGRTLLQKHLADYVARNQFDYFIHKDLQGFLSRELDFYLKNEVLFIDDIDARSTENFLQHLTVLKAIKAVGAKLIQFLASLENYQKRLWLKKKFVVQADYCITLDRIPRSLYADICANEAQRKEWVRLFAIDEIKADGMFTTAYSEPLTEKFLEENPHLVLDTQFFSADFKHRLLSSIDNIDEQCDGLLINSENFQALQLLQEKYKESVKCIYIDPPYNTGGDGFTYKDCYQHSSWLSMMENRLRKVWNTLPNDGVIFISIDDNEATALKELCDRIFGKDNFISNIIIQNNPRGRQSDSFIATVHEYLLTYGKKRTECILNGTPLTEEQKKEYNYSDEKGAYRLLGLRQRGVASLREDRPDMFFPIYVNPSTLKISLKSSDDTVEVLPRKSDGRDGRWMWGKEKCIEDCSRLVARLIERRGEYDIFVKDYLERDNGVRTRKYKSIWDDKSLNNQVGTQEVKALLGGELISFPKSESFIRMVCRLGGNKKDIFFDFFAGSGTTAHAVINLNREDGENGKRKYILCEMGDYFDTVTKPRVEKVVYSKDWKDGKPVSRQGSSHCFKYMRLEQYEDTLNNLVLQPVKIDKQNAEFYGGYMMGYMLDTETRDSLFSLKWFRNPWAMKLRITRQNETREETVDIIETFNYLIGLSVSSQLYPKDGICTLEGTTRRGERTLIIWRDCDKISNKALNDFFTRQAYSTRDTEFDRIYVNGDNNLENLRRDEEAWKVVLTEEEFQRRMFAEC